MPTWVAIVLSLSVLSLLLGLIVAWGDSRYRRGWNDGRLDLFNRGWRGP